MFVIIDKILARHYLSWRRSQTAVVNINEENAHTWLTLSLNVLEPEFPSRC